tara:strand:+ start:120 stop:716 length:597 start_codon:yes stop_codon:yes gene_type:complete
MTSKDAIDKIKNLIKFGTVEAKFEQAKLTDGTIIQWEDELGEGTAIMVVGEDGNVMPAPDATHILEDGTMVTTVGGLVTKVEGKSVETEVEVEEEMAAEPAPEFIKHLEDFKLMVERMTAIENKLAEYESKFSAITETVNNTEASTSDKFAKVIELVEAISSEPATIVEAPKNITYKKIPNKQSAIEIFKDYQNKLNK